MCLLITPDQDAEERDEEEEEEQVYIKSQGPGPHMENWPKKYTPCPPVESQAT